MEATNGVAAPPAEPLPPETAAGPTHEEVEALLVAAKAEGRAEAEAEAKVALAAVEAQAAAELERMVAIADGLDVFRAAIREEARDLCGRFVVQALRRVAMRTPEVLDEILRARCGEVVEQMVGAGDVVVRVHPDDLKLAKRLVGERAGWTVVADKAVKGGCLAESSAGRMDGTLDASLKAVQDAVKAWRAESKR